GLFRRPAEFILATESIAQQAMQGRKRLMNLAALASSSSISGAAGGLPGRSSHGPRMGVAAGAGMPSALIAGGTAAGPNVFSGDASASAAAASPDRLAKQRELFLGLH